MNVYNIFITIIILFTPKNYASDQFCDRRPLGTTTEPLSPDDRFQLNINEIVDNKYIPDKRYTVTLSASDNKSKFIAFSIALSEDFKENLDNKRKPIPLLSGKLIPSLDTNDAKISNICNNTVIQTNILPKTSVQVTWIAPPKGQGCVSIYAVVAIKADLWYNKEGPLLKKICEDKRQKDDMPPQLNNNCMVCEEARYQLTFLGLWSENTHESTFPKDHALARFSDLVGASHNNQFTLWKMNKEASPGLKVLAEQGNTTALELEILSQYVTGVRTLIKAKGQPQPRSSTVATFRASRDHHLFSCVTSILPSPDWFLGAASIELCEPNNKWAKDITLNLYPLDAGTDSGKDFESPNEATSPPQPISRANINNENRGNGNKLGKPFAKIIIELIRTYEQQKCTDDDDSDVTEAVDHIENGGNEKERVQVNTAEKAPTVEETATEESTDDSCPMTSWEDWLPCFGDCIDNKIKGFKTRMRYHLVDGIPVDKYDEKTQVQIQNKEVPTECREKPDSETTECEEPCDGSDPTDELTS